MKDGAVLANAGHFNVEIDIEALERASVEKGLARPNIQYYTLRNGKKVFLLGREGWSTWRRETGTRLK